MNKILLASLVATFAHGALACSPPPMIIAQTSRLSTILRSPEFQTEIQRAGWQTMITKIDGNGDFYLSNGCVIQSKLKYAPPRMPGMCPELVGVEAKTTCLAEAQ